MPRRSARFDVVIKSPGISAYKPALLAAQAQGTQFTSGTALWFGENPEARVIAVTGTKGKSTTSALLAHLARSLGVRTALAGNIGMPLLELLGQQAELWVIELSSFQTGEAGPLELGVITSLYEEHLDWHGSRERYVADKLKLADVSPLLLVNALQPNLLAQTAGASASHAVRPGATAGTWPTASSAATRATCSPIDQLAAPGLHNALNACAALAALEAVGMDALAAAPGAGHVPPAAASAAAAGSSTMAWTGSTIPSAPRRRPWWPRWQACPGAR